MTLLDAVAILLRLKTDVRIICCGDSSDIKISIPLNVKEYFDFRGVISRPEIFQIMEECDLGIVPSLFEQSGYSAIEMLRFGLPCIVSDGFGINDIASGGAAITFQCGNPQYLADEILTFIRLSDNAKKGCLITRNMTLKDVIPPDGCGKIIVVFSPVFDKISIFLNFSGLKSQKNFVIIRTLYNFATLLDLLRPAIIVLRHPN